MENRKNQKGQALVESALTVLAFLMMLLAILDFGQFRYFQQSLAERTRAAARQAVLDPSQVTRIKNVAVYNSPVRTDAAKPLIAGLTTEMVTVRTQDLGTPEGRVTVTISGFPISMVTPGLKNILRSPTTTVTYPSEAPW